MISQTLTDLSFYKDFMAPAEWLLVFQSDSIICAASEYSLDRWVEEGYAYVGAPWFLGSPWGGNGGLSLRHVPKIIQVLEKEKRKAGDELMEDRWLCDRLGVLPGVKNANGHVSSEFSVESVWNDKPFGYHLRGSGELMDFKIWGNKTRTKMVFEHCPEVKIILDMKYFFNATTKH